MSDHRLDEGAILNSGPPLASGPVCDGRMGRMALAAALMAGAAGCSSSPQYPINVGERPGDGSVIAVQPRYPISAADAAQNAADRNAQNGAPGASASSNPYAAQPAASAPPPADAQDDDAPTALPGSSVDSSDLPPPPAASPDDGAPQPHAISWGGGQIVFGTDAADAGALVFAAYHHHRHTAVTAANDPTAADDARPAHRHRHGRAAEQATAAPATAVADTPYQTVVKPGEKLSDVAERTHSSREALVALNAVKHPRRVKAGTVLKIPYRYTYDVQKGDTLYTIAKRFDQDPQAVARLNGLKAVPTLQPGQAIALPPTAADQGRRDHASAAEPVPVAAPETLVAGALHKAERHGRRHAREETAQAPAEPAATPSRSNRRHGRVSATYAESTPQAPLPNLPAPSTSPAAEVAADSVAPRAATSPPPAVAANAPAPAPRTVPAAPRTAVASPPPRAVPPGPVSAVMAASAGAPAYVGVRPYPTPAPVYRSATSTPTPSTYTAPGYVAPGYAAGAQSGRVASLTPPRAMPGYAANSYTPSLGRERAAGPSLPGAAMTSPQIAAAGRGRFIWPLRGAVISPFGDRGAGEHNDGVDIAANTGTGVRAAAAGEVVYAGSSIPGFGNLVLVKHAGGWVTAYAHLDRIEVRMRDSVAQGEEIGLAGQTGAVERSELHFEVRYAPDPTEKARPVDPTLVLPAG